MFEVHIEGFKTKKQAEEFITWYCEQGEQDASIWMEVNGGYGCSSLNLDATKTFPLKWDGNKVVMIVEPM